MNDIKTQEECLAEVKLDGRAIDRITPEEMPIADQAHIIQYKYDGNRSDAAAQIKLQGWLSPHSYVRERSRGG